MTTEESVVALYCILDSTANGELPTFVLRRYYISPSFQVIPQAGQPLPDLICLNRAYLSDALIKLTEVFSLNGITQSSYDCQAKKMTIYAGDKPEVGVILILLPSNSET
jgi:hypothetical protein